LRPVSGGCRNVTETEFVVGDKATIPFPLLIVPASAAAMLSLKTGRLKWTSPFRTSPHIRSSIADLPAVILKLIVRPSFTFTFAHSTTLPGSSQ
jgi:hypothetical protein